MMRYKRFLTIISCLLFTTMVFARNQFTLHMGSSYSSNNLSQLESLLQEVNRDFNYNNVPTVFIEKFPAYFSYNLGGIYFFDTAAFGEIGIGGALRYFSTGGRIHYKDYSGEAGFDALIDRLSFGLLLEKSIIKKIASLNVYSILSYNKSDLSLIYLFRVGESEEYSDLDFNATYSSIELGLVYNYPLYKSISAALKAGYEFSSNGDLVFDDNEEIKLIDSSKNTVKVDWTGFRIGLFLELKL